MQDHTLAQVRGWNDSRPALISLSGNPHPTLMEGLDPTRLARSAPIDVIQQITPMITTNKVAWTVVGAPTKGWADSVGVADLAQLWDAVATAMRLDQADPVAAWRSHVAKLKARATILNAHQFDRIRYRGPGTDLTLGLSARSRWVGGSLRTRRASSSSPTCPPRRSSSPRTGAAPRASCARRPPSSSARWVRSSRASRSRSATARSPGRRRTRGEEAVQAQFELIPRSRHLGEVAIVDADSAVARTNLVYKDMLFDENVGSHVAWGMGYTIGMDGSLELTPEQRIGEGLNQSDTHVDIVIGSPEVQIDGIHADGSVVAVTRGNEFVLKD